MNEGMHDIAFHPSESKRVLPHHVEIYASFTLSRQHALMRYRNGLVNTYGGPVQEVSFILRSARVSSTFAIQASSTAPVSSASAIVDLH